MDPKVMIGLIAAGSAISASLITAIAKSRSSKQKLKELVFQYEKKLQEGYLERARDYTNGIYLPLSIALAKLNTSYKNFYSSTNKDITKQIDEFNDDVNSFLKSVVDLAEQGANAFLTTNLDEGLQSFCSFLTSSKTAEAPCFKAVIRIGTTGLVYGNSDFAMRVSGKLARNFLRSPKLDLGLGFASISYRCDEIVAAPFNTLEFHERFVHDSHLLSVLIKEVTLGSKGRD